MNLSIICSHVKSAQAVKMTVHGILILYWDPVHPKHMAYKTLNSSCDYIMHRVNSNTLIEHTFVMNGALLALLFMRQNFTNSGDIYENKILNFYNLNVSRRYLKSENKIAIM